MRYLPLLLLAGCALYHRDEPVELAQDASCTPLPYAEILEVDGGCGDYNLALHRYMLSTEPPCVLPPSCSHSGTITCPDSVLTWTPQTVQIRADGRVCSYVMKPVR
jgi:hypothetical protein